MTTHTSDPRSRVILVCVAVGIFLIGPGLAASDESPSEARAFDDGGVLMIPAATFSVSVETWVTWDNLAMLQQLGLFPPVE